MEIRCGDDNLRLLQLVTATFRDEQRVPWKLVCREEGIANSRPSYDNCQRNNDDDTFNNQDIIITKAYNIIHSSSQCIDSHAPTQIDWLCKKAAQLRHLG